MPSLVSLLWLVVNGTMGVKRRMVLVLQFLGVFLTHLTMPDWFREKTWSVRMKSLLKWSFLKSLHSLAICSLFFVLLSAEEGLFLWYIPKRNWRFKVQIFPKFIFWTCMQCWCRLYLKRGTGTWRRPSLVPNLIRPLHNMCTKWPDYGRWGRQRDTAQWQYIWPGTTRLNKRGLKWKSL